MLRPNEHGTTEWIFVQSNSVMESMASGQSAPRGRGDDPVYEKMKSKDAACSPRARE